MLRSLVLTTFIAFVLLGVSACSGGAPELRHGDEMPDDLRTLADQTWDDFLAFFPARHDCIRPPTLMAAWELDSRGEYRPGSMTILVRVPGTPATLRSELLHEFAHHLEFTCPDHDSLRTPFRQAQGFAADVDWFDGDTWETTPSEQYAEAVVELIEERRTHQGGVHLTNDAVAVVREWGLGS